MSTLADYIQVVRSDIPASIISDQAFGRILDLTRLLSGTLANHTFVFEVRLHKDPSAVDLSIDFSGAGRMHLLERGSSEYLSQEIASHPIWQKVYRFASAWNDPTLPLQRGIDHTWLEFDLDQPVGAIPVPTLFYYKLVAASYKSPAIDLMPNILALSDIFYGPSRTALLAENLARCLRNLPPGSHIHNIGFGLQRSQDAIRLQIVGPHPQDVPSYLETIGWPYATSSLQPLLDLFSHYDVRALLIDVSTQIKPKVGFEGYFTRYDHCSQEWLEALVEHGWCDPAKRDFLGTFSLLHFYYITNQASITAQRLFHIKCSYDPEKTLAPIDAKAYLFFAPHWCSADVDNVPD